MKRSGDDIRALVGLLDTHMEHLDPLVDENARAEERIRNGADDPLDYAALGYTIHNLYSFIEDYLLRIAKLFENRSSSPRRLVPSMSFGPSATSFETCIEAGCGRKRCSKRSG